MRIGYDAKRMFLNNRGLGNYARNLIYGLVRHQQGNDYYLYTPEVKNEYVSPTLLHSSNIHLRTPTGINKQISSYWRSYKLGKVSSSDKLDIFHGLAQELPMDIKKTKSRSIVTVHDMIFIKHPDFYKPIDRWIYRNKLKFAADNADLILAISKQTKNDLIENFGINDDRIRITYQSCNEVFYDRRTDADLTQVKKKWNLPENFILYVGALNENKNVMVILKALEHIKDRMDLPLVIVGHGADYKERLTEFANKAGLLDRIQFASEIGNPSPRELSAFYQMASVFIFPSFYEGFGIPILESRFSNTPVIASNSSCLDEAGGADTTYFNPNDSEELANYLLDIESLPCEYPAEFKVKNLTENLVEAYKDVI